MKNNSKEKYITLKQAAKISGYAPDYIGQLIRKGKLSGKQVYHGVAWVTSEDAIRKYIEEKKNNSKDKKNLCFTEKVIEQCIGFKNNFLEQVKLAKLFKTVLYLTIILSIGFSLFLFYIFSVSTEKKLQQRAEQKLEAQMINNEQ